MRRTVRITLVLFFVLLIAGAGHPPAAHTQGGAGTLAALGTAITYQGYLEDDQGPVSDDCDIQFALFASSGGADQVGGTQTKTGVTVTDGYFTVEDLDFGSGVFTGEERYLEIAVRCPTGTSDYSTLNPRQPVTAAPYALALPGLYTTPGSEAANVIGGSSDNTVGDGVFGGTIGGGGAGSGANYVYDHASTVSGGANNQAGSDDADPWSGDGATVSGGWNNAATDPVSTVGGGADNAAYAYASTVGGGQANVAEDHGVTIGGGFSNYATGGSSTIAGGEGNWLSGWSSTIGGGYTHTVTADAVVIAGGMANTAEGWGSVIGGGSNNYTGEWVATVGGGDDNSASAPASTVAGGSSNRAEQNESTVGGGSGNIASGPGASVGGGYNNTASGHAATVAGGEGNSAGGEHSFAAGSDAYANHNGSFVWSDTTGGLSSTAPNQFLINAAGGVGIGTDDPGGPGLAVRGSGAGLMYLGSTGIDPIYRTYLGFNVFHDGSSYYTYGDSANNGGALVTADWTSGNLIFHTFPSTGGSNRAVTAAGGAMAIYGSSGNVYIDNTLDIGGDLDIQGNLDVGGAVSYDNLNVTGNTTVGGNLDVGGDYSWQSYKDFDLVGAGEWSFDFADSDGNDDWHVWSPNTGPILNVQNDGRVGIGQADPELPLHIRNGLPYIQFEDTTGGPVGNEGKNQWRAGVMTSADHQYFRIDENTSMSPDGQGGWTRIWSTRFWVRNDGLVGVEKLQITGGDLAEPFQVSGEVEPGMVVVIDPDNEGQLRLSDKANDPLVAGCVSGANGLEAGILMYQEIGEEENAFPVALSGRVYCYADASYGAIQPGDLLTTSDTPGYLMSVSDHDQARGAIVGKAMSALDEGRDLVLILVTLQ